MSQTRSKRFTVCARFFPKKARQKFVSRFCSRNQKVTNAVTSRSTTSASASKTPASSTATAWTSQKNPARFHSSRSQTRNNSQPSKGCFYILEVQITDKKYRYTDGKNKRTRICISVCRHL